MASKGVTVSQTGGSGHVAKNLLQDSSPQERTPAPTWRGPWPGCLCSPPAARCLAIGGWSPCSGSGRSCGQAKARYMEHGVEMCGMSHHMKDVRMLESQFTRFPPSPSFHAHMPHAHHACLHGPQSMRTQSECMRGMCVPLHPPTCTPRALRRPCPPSPPAGPA